MEEKDIYVYSLTYFNFFIINIPIQMEFLKSILFKKCIILHGYLNITD